MDTAISAVELHVNKNYLPTFKQIVVSIWNING